MDDPTRLVELGEKLVASKSLAEPHFGFYLLGAAHYRAGQYAQAAQRLNESIAAFPTGSEAVRDSINYPRLFLAMTEWQRGHQKEAGHLLTKTLRAVEQELQSPSSDWNRRATLELLRDEAETLIGQKKAGRAGDNVERDPPALTTRSQENSSHR
jgi:hypothetical protein